MNGSTLTFGLVGALALGAALGKRGSRARLPNSAAFWEWFRGSMVRDTAGRPLVVYHGSTLDFTGFDQFDAERCNASAGTGVPCGTYFFSSDPNIAATYTGSDGHITPVYLSLRRPLIIDAHGDNWGSIAAERHLGRTLYACKGEYDPRSINQIALFARHVEDDWEPSGEGSWFSQRYRGMVPAEPQSRMDDGLIVKNVRDTGGGAMGAAPFTLGDTYVAFYPWQIKSAVANTTFDPKDPRIHFNRSRR